MYCIEQKRIIFSAPCTNFYEDPLLVSAPKKLCKIYKSKALKAKDAQCYSDEVIATQR
jgi:hypothetical protein